ncbi:unnamed protein product [Caenorhabditis auriculariae]|uniref:Arf-GAP domain-containing protein n=1 Tax=Caenorhabditis auriculariae TaxID=2777116 RepID=A0A8S1GPT7_9PELO|nr:unnamed protein product [Caenorhabditis auriculariae]
MLRGKVDPKKEEQDRLTGILLDMLKEEENKYCADCQAKTPRWAAWNLGVFICIRCAGIHRNLGVHISKVRSVNLDSWTPDQVQTMRVMGNEKARRVYEAELPENFRRPTSDSQMEQFIRSKYEQKRYLLRGFTYPKVDASELPKSVPVRGPAIIKKPITNVDVNYSGKLSPSQPNGNIQSKTVNDLLDFSGPSETVSAGPPLVDNLFADFADLSIQQQQSPNPAPSDDFDDFGSFVSASTAGNSSNQTANGQDFADFASASQPPVNLSPTEPAAASTGDIKRSNADILSLFGPSLAGGGRPPNSLANGTAPVLVAPGGFTAFGIQAAPQSAQQSYLPNVPISQATTTYDAFGGLGSVNLTPSQQFPQQSQPMMAQQFGAFPPPQLSSGFGMAAYGASQPKVSLPTSTTTSAAGFSIPNKNNAFADLSLGKVMKTSYGQSAIHPAQQPIKAPSPSGVPTTKSAAVISDDPFGMFNTAPPSITAATTTTNYSSTNFDDLLGL